MDDILYLYSRLNGFVLSVAERIAAAPECGTVHIVHWDAGKDNGNKFEKRFTAAGLRLIGKSELGRNDIVEMILRIKPRIIYLSGWMDKDYIAAIRIARRKGAEFQTICGIDDQWFGNLRQKIGSLYFRLFYRPIYDFMWIAGKPQYHYARMMGYPHDRIIPNLLSADTGLFRPAERQERRFVFFGRFERIKGLDTLIAAHETLSEQDRRAWPLVLIGDGELRGVIEGKQSPYVRFIPYLQPDELARELARGGVGMLTSTFEAWSVGLHELALMGYPLIVSRQCGAASEFLIHGYNGFLFQGGDTAALTEAMRAMIALSDESRVEMGRASMLLAQRITPEISARSLLSLLASPRMPVG